jgi:hypothetical protein
MTTAEVLRAIAVFLGLLALQALVLHLFGQPPICECGYVEFWHGAVLSAGNSQHVTDWYTFSHIIHGFLFYLALRYLFPRMPMWQRFLIAAGVEIAWELIENTPMIIEHYREQALAQGYTGDSIINSVCDTLAMAIGFFMASRMPVWSIILIGLGLEAWTAYEIRDGLALNIINLLHHFDFIARWQAGG